MEVSFIKIKNFSIKRKIDSNNDEFIMNDKNISPVISNEKKIEENIEKKENIEENINLKSNFGDAAEIAEWILEVFGENVINSLKQDTFVFLNMSFR